jgi:hypothetical protein
LQLDQVLNPVTSNQFENPSLENSENKPVDDVQSSILIPLTNISSSEPTIFRKDSWIAIEIWPLIVALEN